MSNMVINYFKGLGFSLKPLGRRGQHEADWSAESFLGCFPVEEKKIIETVGYSSWWSFWKSKLSNDFLPRDLDLLSAQDKGWIAVIYGELRDWCNGSDTSTGYLVVEAASTVLGKSKQSVLNSIMKTSGFLNQNNKSVLENWELLRNDYLISKFRF
jgi:hypothetical protein